MKGRVLGLRSVDRGILGRVGGEGWRGGGVEVVSGG